MAYIVRRVVSREAGLSRSAVCVKIPSPIPSTFVQPLLAAGDVGVPRGILETVPVRTFAKRKNKKSTLSHEGDAEGRKLALEHAMKSVEAHMGKGSIMRLGDKSIVSDVETIPTGSLALDMALGIGGLPVGRVIEIYGPESSGKTTLALHVIAEAQKQGKTCLFVDAEHAIDLLYAKKLGVDVDDLLLSQPDSGENALEITEMMIRSGAIDLVVIDSVAALVPRVELEGEMGDHHIATQARLMSQALRKLTALMGQQKSTVIFINQIRQKVGIMFGSNEVTAGGNALKYYASVRLDIRRREQIKEGGEAIGNLTRVKVVKNKVAPPFREATFDVMYGKGICQSGELVDAAVKFGLIHKAGAWYSFPDGVRIGQGRDKAKHFFDENPDLAEELRDTVHQRIKDGAEDGELVEIMAPGAATDEHLPEHDYVEEATTIETAPVKEDAGSGSEPEE